MPPTRARCVATDKYGMPEVVIDGKTGYVFPSGDVSPSPSPR
jgi:glycosyltransferase involved in cell wall biosynthesis